MNYVTLLDLINRLWMGLRAQIGHLPNEVRGWSTSSGDQPLFKNNSEDDLIGMGISEYYTLSDEDSTFK